MKFGKQQAMVKAKKNDIRISRDWSGFRIAGIGVFLGLALVALWIRAYYVQIIRGPELSEYARRQHTLSESQKGERGQIFDRRGRLLAKSVWVKSIYVRPLEVDDKEKAAAVLAKTLDKPESWVMEKLSSKTNFVWLARQVGDKTAADVLKAGIAGVYLSKEGKRLYPYGHLAGQLIGVVGVDGNGLAGIEQGYEEHLAGRSAEYITQKDAGGRRMFFDTSGRLMDVRGKDVQLTIDGQIQFWAEDELARAVIQHKAKAGVCLVVEVASGDILAWASYPFFNPNINVGLDSRQWRNRPIMDAFEPGSTMKPLVVAAALQEKTVNPDSLYNCEGGNYKVSTATIKDTHKYGWLPVHKIVRYSSNIGALKIGFDLGAPRLYDYMKRLGLGEMTSLDLPGENKGIVRGLKSWSRLDLATASFGQGFAINSVQLATAFLTLGDEGRLKSLRVVRDPGRIERAPYQVFSPDVCKRVLSMMRDVVQLDGTGTQARIEGISVGGKTGTAQKAKNGAYGDFYMGSFVAFIPGDKPEYFIAVLIDEPKTSHYGGVVAAPTVREVAIKTLAYAGKPPQGAKSNERKEPEQAPEENYGASRVAGEVSGLPREPKPGEIPNVVGLSLRKATELLIKSGITPDVEGFGEVVIDQSPVPGEAKSEDGESKPCKLVLGGV